jgi:hypothetical protein
MDPDADSTIFLIDLQDANKNKFFCKILFFLLLFEGAFTTFSKIKSQTEVTKQYESRFFLLYLLKS